MAIDINIKPILGGDFSTKPFKVDNGNLKVLIEESDTYEPVINGLYSNLLSILNGDKNLVLTANVVESYLNSIGLNKIVNQYINNKYSGYYCPQFVINDESTDPNVGDIAISYDETSGVYDAELDDTSGDIVILFEEGLAPISGTIIINNITGEVSGEYDTSAIEVYEKKLVRHLVTDSADPDYLYQIGYKSKKISDNVSEPADITDRINLIAGFNDDMAVCVESLEDKINELTYIEPIHFNASLIINNVINDTFGDPPRDISNNPELNKIVKHLYLNTEVVSISDLRQVNEVIVYPALYNFIGIDNPNWMIGIQLLKNGSVIRFGSIMNYSYTEEESLSMNNKVITNPSISKLLVDTSGIKREIDHKELVRLIDKSNISDYISLDHIVKSDGTGEGDLLSLDNIYYDYDQLFYHDDEEIYDDPQLSEKAQEIKYAFIEIPINYSRLVNIGDTIEFVIQYVINDQVRLSKVIIDLTPEDLINNIDGIELHNSIKFYVFDKVLNKNILLLEASSDNVVIYSLDDMITEYRVLTARVLN